MAEKTWSNIKVEIVFGWIKSKSNIPFIIFLTKIFSMFKKVPLKKISILKPMPLVEKTHVKNFDYITISTSISDEMGKDFRLNIRS